MRILIITDNLVRGGKERRLIELLKGLKKNKVHCELCIFSKVIEYEEIHDMDIPLHILERHPKKDPRVFGRFLTLCKEVKPDLIHSWGSMPSIYAIPSVARLKIPFLNALITDAPHNMRLWESRLFRAKLTFPFSDLVLGNSEAGLTAYGVPWHKSLCIHNGFDFKRLRNLEDPAVIRQQYGIQTEKVGVMVGKFEPRKDYESYVKAAIKVIDERNDVSFVAAGDGSMLETIKQMVPASYQQRIHFPGRVNQVEALVKASDIGILLSNKSLHGEGISNSILEYMALRKPVIATDCGGTNEIVIPKVNGYLVNDKDVSAVSSYIHQLLNEPEKASQFGKAGHQLVRDSFNLDKMTDKHIEIYLQLIKNRGRDIKHPMAGEQQSKRRTGNRRRKQLQEGKKPDAPRPVESGKS